MKRKELLKKAIFLVGIGLISGVLMVGCATKEKEKPEKTETKQEVKEVKEEEEEDVEYYEGDYVEDAEYTLVGLKGFEIAEELKGEKDSDNFVLPKFKFDSAGARKANDRIKEFYEKVERNFNNREEYEDKVEYNVHYDTFINKDVLSVEVYIFETLGNVEKLDQMMFNFDMKTKKTLKFDDLLKKKGMTVEELDKKMEEQIDAILESEDESTKESLREDINIWYNDIKQSGEGEYCLMNDFKIHIFIPYNEKDYINLIEDYTP